MLISAVKTILSHSNQHENIDSPNFILSNIIIANIEAIEVQNKSWGNLSNFDQNGQ